MNEINHFRGAAKLIAIATLQLLPACAGPQITALDVQIAQAQAEAARACYAARQIPQYADARDAALLLMAQSLSGDPCRQTNVYDARQSIAAAQNQAASGIVSGVTNTGIAALGIVAGADLLKTAVKNSGSTIIGDRNISTRADGASRAQGPDLSTAITTTTNTQETGEDAP